MMSEEEIESIADQLCNDPEFIEMVQDRIESSVDDWKTGFGIAAVILATGLAFASVILALNH